MPRGSYKLEPSYDDDATLLAEYGSRSTTSLREDDNDREKRRSVDFTPRGVIISPEAGYPGLPIDDAPPVLKKGFGYLNDETRPRREFLAEEGEFGVWKKMEFGEPGGELFPVWTSTPWDLREFGLGVAMYFQMLQLLSLTFFVCGIFQAQTMEYYKSAQYSDGQEGVPFMLKGSAVCTRHEIVCLDSECMAVGKANLCHIGTKQAYFDITMTLVMFALLVGLGVSQDAVSAKLDEAMQTASDYSVLVDDPGEADDDPDEWRDFFQQFGHVTFVTIAKNNGPLLVALANRRVVMREIIMIIGNGVPLSGAADDSLDNRTWGGMDFKTKIHDLAENPFQPNDDPSDDAIEQARDLISKAGIFKMKPMKHWVNELARANEEVQAALAEAHYIPCKVFATFETEVGQRNCLAALSLGLLSSVLDYGKDSIPDEYEFKGNVLSIAEAAEPAEVFWYDVDITFSKRIKQQSLTFGITVAIVVASVAVCKGLQIGTGAGGAALWISLSNILVPEAIRQMTFNLEDHVSLRERSVSLYLKLTFFRWMNTAVVLYFITDFSDFLTAKALNQVQAVLVADALSAPLIRTLNPMDAINQLIVSNYAPTQEKMNSYFLGADWFPAERFADMTKTLFLALFYCALLPSGLFLTCFGFSLTYMVDKYSLLRTWRTPAEVDDDLAVLSRGYMTLAVYSHSVMTMVFFSEFPFDNICAAEGGKRLDSWRFQQAQINFGATSDVVHQRCDQAVSSRLFTVFFGGSLARDSMYGKQQRVVRLYGVLVAILTVILFVAYFGVGIVCGCYHLFYGSYDNDSEAQSECFTTCDIQAYIPCISHPRLAYPLVAADMTQFQSKYLTFELPDDSAYMKQNLFNPVELPGLTPAEMRSLFSEVRYYPPPEGLVELPIKAKAHDLT